jgi:ABC-type branched-subunit amino acid transport system ATPase component
MLQAARTMPDTLAHPAAADARPDLIVVQGVSKRFGSTAALQDVSLRGRAGSIHAITGENGAGKSTLMKLLAGVHQPDAGEIRMAGQRLQLRSPAAARAAGISTVFQELTVLPNLTVAENLVLGREPRRARARRRRRILLPPRRPRCSLAASRSGRGWSRARSRPTPPPRRCASRRRSARPT